MHGEPQGKQRQFAGSGDQPCHCEARKKRFGSNPPNGGATNGRRIPLAQALETKLSEVADEISGRTYSEMIADKLVNDDLRGKLPVSAQQAGSSLRSKARRAIPEPDVCRQN